MVSLTARARCRACGPIAEGDPETVDKVAEKHVAVGHPTTTEAWPARAASAPVGRGYIDSGKAVRLG